MTASPDIAALPYRPCVGIMLLNKQNQVFVGQRIDNTAEAWQMPQGGLDDGEETYACGLRELEEETGVTDVSFIGESKGWLQYDLPPELVGKLWKGKYRGQVQKWYVLRLEADDSHINIATKEPEFRAWRWAKLDELPALIVPFKRELYQKLVDEFRPLVNPSSSR